MSELGSGDARDTGALLARELRDRLGVGLQRAEVKGQWDREHPGRSCVVVGGGTPQAPFVTVGYYPHGRD